MDKRHNKHELALPIEIMIEVEPKCNFDCRFCFNKISFAKKGRNQKGLNVAYVKKLLDHIADLGIRTVRFTGGEPLLRPDIFELLQYAKAKKLTVRLNTNGSLITLEKARKMAGLVDSVLIPVESYNDQDEARITGHKKSLSKKIKAIRWLKQAGIPTVRVGTVALSENIVNFEKIAALVLRLPIYAWEWYRPIALKNSPENLTRDQIGLLAEKMMKVRKKTAKKVYISNPIPFCSIKDPKKLKSVSSPVAFEYTNGRLVADPRGFLKPHYFVDEKVGDPLDILAAWNHPWLKKMRDPKNLPSKCRRCKFRLACGGGNRFAAWIHSGKIDAPDPLADPAKAAGLLIEK